MVCIDSDIIINFLRKEKNAFELINQLKDKGELITTTVINSFELWKGYYRFKNKTTFDTIEQFLSEIEILLLEPKSSQKAAEIFELLSSEGQIIDALDVMIASISLTNNQSLLTENRKHFERIDGLILEEL